MDDVTPMSPSAFFRALALRPGLQLTEGKIAMTTLKNRFLPSCGAVLMVLATAPTAPAQNALGSGNALDSGLSTSGRTNRPVTDFDSELRFRNAIVTGNAPGGVGFRGDVGYRAAGDFTGGSAIPFNLRNATGLGLDAGSNDLFQFELDSFYSGLASRGVSGIDALQYQMRLQTGSLSGELPVLPILRRPSQPAESSLWIGSEFDAGRIPSLNSFSIAPGTLRSTSEFLSNAYLDPTLLRADRPGDGVDPSFTIATPLRGIAVQSAPTFTTDILTTDLLIPKSSSELVNEMRSPNQISNRIEPVSATTSYDQVLRDLRSFDQDEERDRDLLKPTLPGQPQGLVPNPAGGVDRSLPGDSNLLMPGDAGAAAAPVITLEQRLSQLRAAMSTTRSQTVTQDQQTRQQVEDTLEMLKGAQPVVSRFAPETNEQRDLFSEQMRRGELMLENGRWFDAEEHFASALSMRPGEALAAAGRIHAELGAGLFLSAAVNLQKLLRENPGMIPVRYDAVLLPSRSRIGDVMIRLRENSQRSNSMGRNSGFLLAYLGYQINDQNAVREGFDAIQQITESLGEEPNPFYDVVRRVWLD